jgi:hypothetical protein
MRLKYPLSIRRRRDYETGHLEHKIARASK